MDDVEEVFKVERVSRVNYESEFVKPSSGEFMALPTNGASGIAKIEGNY